MADVLITDRLVRRGKFLQEKTWGRKSREFKVHSLIDKVYKLLNLYIAWEKVKANKGAGGVDGYPLEILSRI